MEIYVYQREADLRPPDRRLTNARGYDAEGSYSPDGQWIVVHVDARRATTAR